MKLKSVRRLKRYLTASAATLLIGTAAAAPTNSFPALKLARAAHGEEAIRDLADKLPAVAAFYHKSPAELRELFRRDKDLHTDRHGRLFYTCQLAGAGSTNKTATSNLTVAVVSPVANLVPLSQTFLLHSKPGSSRTIFLDFDGHTLSNNAWTASNNSSNDIVAPPWDTDGNPAEFGTDEQTAIQQIWLRVAEDYAPFDVDVTTEYPGEAKLTRSSFGDSFYGMRALISPISSYFGAYGGIAYNGVFDYYGDDYYKPALIFPENLGNNEKYIAEAVSHEVGHTLGLSHQGIVSGTSYYTGQGDWAPIMGVGYYHPLSQWARGQYANANNTENALAIITVNGVSYRTDDYGNTNSTATALTGTSITNNGIIERTNDVDFFSFSTVAGPAQFTATGAERGGNLHLKVSIYNSSGSLVTNLEAVDNSNGAQPVSINPVLGNGTYYVSVNGTGSGDPLTSGYSAYGSLGQYTLTIALPLPDNWLPTAAGSYSWMNAANWLSSSAPNSVDKIVKLTSNLTGDEIVSLDGAITIGQLAIGGTNSTHSFVLQDGAGGSLAFDVITNSAVITKTVGTNDVIAASITLVDNLVVSNATAARLTFSGPITGSRAFTKSGTGLVALGGTNSYTGSTIITKGTLALDATAKFTGNAFLDVRFSTVLDATALGGGLGLTTGQTLAGVGAVLGNVTLNTGSALNPGSNNVIGTLTLSNNLTLGTGSTTTMKISRSPFTNDVVRCSGALNFGGTLVLTNLNGTLVVGDSFPLFPAASRAGNFTAITGSAGPQKAFGFNPASGIVNVFTTNPTNLAAWFSNNALQVSWPLDHTGWRLQMQTNGLGASWLDVPNSNTTNRFVIPIDPTKDSVFYRLIYP